MKTNNLILLWLLIVPLVIYAQNASGDILNSFNLQPEVSHFNNISTAQVDNKGDLNLSLPIMNVPGREGMEFPITFSYHAPILRNQRASWIGLGWNFDPGSITRDVQGGTLINEDGSSSVKYRGVDFDSTVSTYMPDIYHVNLPGKGGGSFSLSNNFGSYSLSQYLVNWLPVQGPFYFHKWRPWKISYESDNNCVGNPFPNSNTPWNKPENYKLQVVADIKKFVITTEDGSRFVFGHPSMSSYFNVWADVQGEKYVNTWRLVAILSPDYVGPDVPSLSTPGKWIKFEYKYDGSNDYGCEMISAPKEGLLQLTYLHKIITPTHFAQFTTSSASDINLGYDTDQDGINDVYPHRRLQDIKLYSHEEPTLCLKKVELSQSYELAYNTTYAKGKNTLLSIKYYDLSNQEIPGYKFSYNSLVAHDDDNPPYWDKVHVGYPYPDMYYDNWDDDFGFYDSHNTAKDYFDDDTTDADAWCLKKVEYPTGGSETYYYANDRMFSESERLKAEIKMKYQHFYEEVDYYAIECFPIRNPGPTLMDEYYYFKTSSKNRLFQGGTRIKKIIRDDGHNNVSTDIYTYGAGVPSGIPPKHFEYWNDRRWWNSYAGYTNGCSGTFKNYYTPNVRGSLSVFYEWVKTYNLETGISSKTIYNIPAYEINTSGEVIFNDPDTPPITCVLIDNGMEEVPGHGVGPSGCYGNENILWGEPEKVEITGNNYSETIEYSYSSELPANRYLMAQNMKFHGTGVSGDGSPVHTQWVMHEKTLEKHTKDGVAKSTEYDYDNAAKLVSKTSVTNSNSEIMISKIDYAYTEYSAMQTANMLSQPAQQTIYEGSISSTNAKLSAITTYKDWGNNKWALERIYNWDYEGDNPNLPNFDAWASGQNPSSSQWLLKSKITSRDDNNSPIEFQDAKGTTNSVKWGYNESIANAVIQNSSYSECFYDGFESGDFTGQEISWGYGVASGGTSSREITSEDSHTGDCSLKMIKNDDLWNGVYMLSPFITVTPGEEYTIQVWYKCDPDRNAYINWYDYSHSQSHVKTQVGTGKWELIEHSYVAPAGCTEMRVYLYGHSPEGSPDTPIYYDDVRVYPSDALFRSRTMDKKFYQVSGITDEAGVSAHYEYDDFGRLSKIKNNDGRTLEEYDYYYSRSGNVNDEYDPTDPNSVTASTETFSHDFEYTDAPENHNWIIYDPAGTMSTVYDNDLESMVLQTTTGEGTGFGIKYPSSGTLENEGSYLSVKMKASNGFVLYIRVRDTQGSSWYLTYRPSNGTTYESNSYINIYLGTEYQDGSWRTIKRDLQKDLDFVGREFESVSVFYIRGQYDLDDLTLSHTGIPNKVITYFDGLGRNIQTQQKLSDKDIVTAIDYDALSRPVKQWKPYIADTDHKYTDKYDAGDGVSGSAGEYYDGDPGTDVDNYAYIETKYRNGFSDEVSEVGNPGIAFNLGSGHTQQLFYGANSSGDVSGYSENTLYRIETIDENRNNIETFKDKFGNIILNRNLHYIGHFDVHAEAESPVIEQETDVKPFTVEFEQSVSWECTLITEGISSAIFKIYEDGNPSNPIVNKSGAGSYSGSFTAYPNTTYQIYAYAWAKPVGGLYFAQSTGSATFTATRSTYTEKNPITTTQFEYDILGNLTKTIHPNSSETENEYNTLGQLISTSSPEYDSDNDNVYNEPGEQDFEYVYDRSGQVRLWRDPAHKNGKDYNGSLYYWQYNKYDILGRLIEVGVLSNTADRATAQSLVDAETYQYETKIYNSGFDLDPHSYSNDKCFPASGRRLYDIRYYDDYNFDNDSNNDPDVDVPVGLTYSKGKLTAIFTKHSIYTSSWNQNIRELFFYDKFGNLAEYRMTHPDPLVSEKVFRYEHDISGNLIYSSYQEGHADELYYWYEYDLSGRLSKVFVSVYPSKPATPEVFYTYTAEGQVERMELGDNAQGVDYRYNPRGWITGINKETNDMSSNPNGDGETGSAFPSDKFTMIFGYERDDGNIGGSLGSTAKYNGNISWVEWQSYDVNNTYMGLTGYVYDYDDLDRLTKADYSSWNSGWDLTDNTYDVENLSYDKLGNIKTLLRYAYSQPLDESLKMDELSYQYNPACPNRLSSITDAVSYTVSDHEADDATYAYEVNGNLISDTYKNITNIIYNHRNQPEEIQLGDGNKIYFKYDASGNRIQKETSGGLKEFYVRDANGKEVAIYDHEGKLIMYNLYGLDLIGKAN